MTNREACRLRDIATGLAETHRRAAAAYREMAGHADSTLAHCLLECLAKREDQLAGEVAVLAGRVDPGARVPRPVPAPPEVPPVTGERLDVDAVIAKATRLEKAIETLLHAVASPPVHEPALLAELFAIHRRELLGLGAEASRLRQSLE
ncbi:hypothetical protein PC39_05720 [Salinisphaera sp. PC39]|uniref:hypothetical protein n=1 Tax=Salinisphaera sp. PC39 TaxID=1304156 RepID=UPI00333FA26C